MLMLARTIEQLLEVCLTQLNQKLHDSPVDEVVQTCSYA